MPKDLEQMIERARQSRNETQARLRTKRASQADRNREAMPNVAALVDEFRAAGFTFKVLGAHDFETGKKVGQI